MLIAGEAGIGKSRLITEAIAIAQGFLPLKGACFEQDLSFPYAPLIDALRSFFARRTPAEVSALLGPLAAEFVKLLPELALTLPDLQPTPALDLEAEKRRLFEALGLFLMRLAQSQPLLMIIEDIHWSDETSLDFLHFFARRLALHPILFIASYRQEEVTPRLAHFLAQVDRERLAQEITLGPLTPGEVDAMLRSIFDLPHSVRPEFLNLIFTLTEGNPFFIEEVLKAMVEAGDIYRANGGWERKPIEELRVPRSVQEAVRQRSAQLSQAARQVLALAAVAGQRFEFTLLQELTHMDEHNLLQRLKEGIAAQLIVEESADQFRFRHALTREAVYAGMLIRERRRLHRVVAEVLERLYADSLDLHLAELAYHYYQAEAWRRC